ncbi:hypothetical protein ABZ804_21985 [Streptomyces sp. NPDC047726]|uniref:hypothetical protein n=1 Tax=unclassified Streptomyces TaxID=2593676 RepID=UPI0033DE4FDB
MLTPSDTSSDHLTSAAYAFPTTSRSGRILREFRVVLRRRAPYFAPAGAASAWGGWIYTEAWLTDPGWIEPLSYGGAGALIGAATAGAVAWGIRQPTALYGGLMTTGTLLWSA